MASATCHTADCPSENVTIDPVTLYVETDEGTVRVDSVVCGACGQPITDIRE